jgi:hypothetical protein
VYRDKAQTPIALVDLADTEVLGRATCGDAGKFAHLVARHRERLTRVAARITRSRADAEDVVQDVLLRTWQQATHYVVAVAVDENRRQFVPKATADWIQAVALSPSHLAFMRNPTLQSLIRTGDSNRYFSSEEAADSRYLAAGITNLIGGGAGR